MRPLKPIVVRLDSGIVASRAYNCLDTAYYRTIRLGMANDQLRLAARALSIKKLKELRQRDSVSLRQQAAELQSSRKDNAQLHVDLRKQEERTAKVLALPLQRPLLFDSRTYTVGGGGLLVGLLLGILLTH